MFNLFANLFPPAAAEEVDCLLRRPRVRIERIVSHGQTSPPGFWYDQAEHEWLVVLSGAAHVRLAAANAVRVLGPGDVLHLAPHERHRVEWTLTSGPTVWLAIFWPADTA